MPLFCSMGIGLALDFLTLSRGALCALRVNSPTFWPATSRYNGSVTRFLPILIALSLTTLVHPQESRKSAAPEKAVEPQSPAQIELLETEVRFESNGDSRKEVHCVVKINSELGIRQFARLNFDYDRAFQQVEIPLVRVTHSSGGTADILPSAITDNPNPAVVNFPAYNDVRVKSVRILGLAPSDTLEYRVVTTTTHHPLAPDFWLDHTFDRTGIVSHELFTLDLPGEVNSTFTLSSELYGPSHKPGLFLATPFTSVERSGEGASARSIYHWKIDSGASLAPARDSRDISAPDILVSTFRDWDFLAYRIGPPFLQPSAEDQQESADRLRSIVANAKAKTAEDTLRAAYDFVSQKLTTVDLPVGVSGFRLRSAKDIFTSGYATAEEKCAILTWLVGPTKVDARLVFLIEEGGQQQFARPSALQHPFVWVRLAKKVFALDPSLEIAPFGLIASRFRGGQALSLRPFDYGDYTGNWALLPSTLPSPAFQRVNVEASLATDGTLTAKVRYLMRGDNELLLRETFHQSPREKWTEVAQLLSLSDGFRGKVGNVSASDPSATKDPFVVEYEITQSKFVDWSKKIVRIPAILPLVALPDPPERSVPPAAPAIILGTPLDVNTTLTLHLPSGTTVESPAGTSVDRDYAKFSSTYAATGNTLTAMRHIQFILRDFPANRAADYNAFLHAVQNDQAQRFTLTNPDIPGVKPPNAAKP